MRKTLRGGLGVVVAAAALLAATPAAAQKKSDIQAAEESFVALDYAEANRAAQRALASRGLAREDVVRAYKLLAFTHAASNEPEKAKDAFVHLLALEPEFALDSSAGPSVQGPFFEARGIWRAKGVRPGLDASAALNSDGTPLVRVKARDPMALVKTLVVLFRWDPTAAAKPLTVDPKIGAVSTGAAPPGARTLEYWVEARDERDSVVYAVGGPTSPQTLSLPERAAPTATVAAPAPPEPSSSGVPWVAWGVTAALTAGAVGTGVAALSASSSLKDEQRKVGADPDRLDSLSSSAKTLGLVSDVCTVGAVVAGGVSLYLTLRSGRAEQPRPDAARPSPRLVVGVGHVGIAGGF